MSRQWNGAAGIDLGGNVVDAGPKASEIADTMEDNLPVTNKPSTGVDEKVSVLPSNSDKAKALKNPESPPSATPNKARMMTIDCLLRA
ncbi:hypothetical protein VKT23_014138 [Stygiomarasmius scandens]|uniref:Uncharacterized protein n=1 Tax=Marasmiellus scandens TaxID=2682957 RepID=A0ABR1J2N8_9AGAR